METNMKSLRIVIGLVMLLSYSILSINCLNAEIESNQKVNCSGVVANKWAEGYAYKNSVGENFYIRFVTNNKSVTVDVSAETYNEYHVGDHIVFENVRRGDFPVEDLKFVNWYDESNSCLSFIMLLVNATNITFILILGFWLIINLFELLFTGKLSKRNDYDY